MSDPETKLRRGAALLERGAGDPDLCGAALLAVHGAMEAQLRAQLAGRHDLTPQERRQVELFVSGAPLLALAQRYLTLNPDEQEALRWANELRRQLARGESFVGSRGELASYARLVEEYCGLSGVLEDASSEEQARAATAVMPTYEASRQFPWRVVAPAAALLALLAAVWFLFVQLDAPGLIRTTGILPMPTATPGPTATPLPPTPAPRTGRIVRLGGGPGWLHTEPSFSSPTLPIRLDEGDQVILLDRQQNDLDGNPWVYVSIEGYDGWSPANNVESAE